MKLYHIIGLSTAALLSLGALGLMTQTESIEYNTDYRIETLSGDISYLDNIQLENIAKTGTNTFSKVTLTNQKTTLKPTQYDLYHGVGEEVLDNRELYRNLTWPATLETDQYLITANFNLSYYYTNTDPILRIRSKDKQINTINNQEFMLENFEYGDNVLQEYLTEINGNYYYLVHFFNNQAYTNEGIIIYQFNPQTLQMNYKSKQTFDSASVTINDEFIYILSHESNQLNITNIKSNQTTTYTIEGLSEYPYLETAINVKNKLLLMVNSDLYQVELNNETNQATASLVTPPNFIQLLRDEYDYYYPYSIVETNGLIYQLYYARKNNTDYQYLSVMNPSTNEFIYEGRIILRSDQGLVNNYQLKSLD